MPNKRACTFISGKVCILTLIEPKIQTLPEINVHARSFCILLALSMQIVNFLIEFLFALYCFMDFTERDLHW